MQRVIPYAVLIWLAVLVGTCLWLVVRRRSAFDRILALDLLAMVLLAFLVQFVQIRPSKHVLDVALVLALLSFLGTVGSLRYVRESRVFCGVPILIAVGGGWICGMTPVFAMTGVGALPYVLTVIGALLISAAVYGTVWLPDVYNRVHAAGTASLLGVMLFLMAAIMTLHPAEAGRCLLIGVVLALTSPVSSHALAHTAYRKGVPMADGGRAR